MKKFWEKYKIVIIAIVGILAFVGLSVLTENINKAQTTEAQEDISVLTSTIPNDKYSIVVIGLTYCQHCHNFNPIITKISSEYNLPLYWFDIDALPEEEAQTLSETFESDGYSGSSPYIAVLNNGKVISTHVGEMGRDNTLQFLKEAKVIK